MSAVNFGLFSPTSPSDVSILHTVDIKLGAQNFRLPCYQESDGDYVKKYLAHRDLPNTSAIEAIAPYFQLQTKEFDAASTTTMILINTIRGLQQVPFDLALTQDEIMQAVDEALKHEKKHPSSTSWSYESGPHDQIGVTLDKLGVYIEAALKCYGIAFKKVEVVHISDENDATLAAFESDLIAMEKEPLQNFIIANYDQALAIGDATHNLTLNEGDFGGDFSLVTCYSHNQHRLVVMDQDCDSNGILACSVKGLLEAMNTHDTSGEAKRGYIRIELY